MPRRIKKRAYDLLKPLSVDVEHVVYYESGSSGYFGGMPVIDPDCPKLARACPELRDLLLGKSKRVGAEKLPRRRRVAAVEKKL